MLRPPWRRRSVARHLSLCLSLRRILLSLLLVLVLGVLATAAGAWWWVHAPLKLTTPAPVDLSVEPGMRPRAVAQTVRQAGVDVDAQWLFWWFRLSGDARAIRAGSYEIEAGATPASLLRKLTRGEESLQALVLVEGWNFRQVRAAMAREPSLRQDTRGLSDAQVMEQLGRPGVAPEGRFFPDTYTYGKGASDLSVLARALKAMDRKLQAAWYARAEGIAVTDAQQMLILASIVEKETGQPSDRPLISAVFHNRLRLGMPLQTDPTVIYGMGERFDGNLRKRDLQEDTPWNTYTRRGLPPTPIAMPGQAALLAAVQPAASRALYFVARGDGSSQFSESLEAHNRAVDQYQRNPGRASSGTKTP